MKYKSSLFFFCFLSLFAAALYAQEAPAEAEATPVLEDQGGEAPAGEELSKEEIPEEAPPTPEQQRMELEIRASTLPELAAWCRTLGLSEGGTREELSRRLREHLALPEPKETANLNQKVITIESAQTTEYFTIDVIDEDYARLKGGVSLSLIDKDSTHRIKANEILFNRTRNILTASGNVEYIKDKGDTTEIFRGENITVNIDDWSSIFLDGISVRKLGKEDTAYRFEGKVISRSDDDVTVLRDAQVGNANNEEALWSISATKIWLLPGSDFALFNAVLKVGEIPVLYIPFFFYPADDLIFHPVIGYRSREGGYVQTTTYILGRPKADSSETSSISRILGSSNDMEKEHNGIFLRSTGRKIKNQDEISLRALIDYYVNLGAYVGVDLSIPRKGILNSLDLSMGAGFTRTVTQIGGNYNPFAPTYDGTSDWNRANLFSYDVPFRYRIKAESSIGGTYGSLSLNFPYYSDPFIDKDFMKRSEFMDWFNMMQQGAALEDEDDERSDIQTYQWQLNGSLRPSVAMLSPYISSLSVSTFSMTMAFKKIDDKFILANNEYAPSRTFFAPDKFTIYSISGSVSGTPLTIGGDSQTGSNTAKKEIEDPFKGIGTPRSPWPAKEEEEQTQKKSSSEKLVPPALSQRFDLTQAGNNKFSVDYQLSPTSSTELQFRSGYDNWQSFEDVDWGEIQSILASFGGNGSVKFSFDHTSGFYSNSVTFFGNGTWREYSYINEEAEAYKTPQTPEGEPDEKRIEDAKKQQYGQTNYSTSYTYNGSVRPLYKNSIFGQSNINYTFTGTLAKSKKYTDGDGPELTQQWGAWVKDNPSEDILGLTSHRISANAAANIMEKTQNVSFSSDLPPLDPLLRTDMTFRAWISETNANVQFRKPELVNNEENDKWIIDPFNLTETLRFGSIGTFSYYMVTDPERDNEITTITSSLSLWSFRASFSAVKSVKWEFAPDDPDNPSMGGKWQQTEDEQALHPRDLTLSYIRSFAKRDIIKDRLNFSVNINSRLFFDLQRYTNSNFQLSMGFTLGIGGFMDISLSATSENAVIWRYFKNFPGMEDITSMYIDGDQNNVFIDLIDSFNFADESKRQRTGFKMKSFNLTADHYLGDWTASLGIIMSPYLNNNLTPPKYEINAEVTFLVKWTAISEIKTDLKYEKKTETWTKR
jgi:hypothetical protein